jgi:site-specific DNA recombinase
MAATSNGTPAPKPVRCAIYTRKSTEEGLNQEFNSLDAQREAARLTSSARSTTAGPWCPPSTATADTQAPTSNGPACGNCWPTSKAGKIDCVVVYKVDRLSRSLIDFAKMMELFEKRGVCFVSVTQQFNTNSSWAA